MRLQNKPGAHAGGARCVLPRCAARQTATLRTPFDIAHYRRTQKLQGESARFGAVAIGVVALPTGVAVLCGSVVVACLLLYVGIFAIQFRLLRDVPTLLAPLSRAERERSLRALRRGILTMGIVFFLLTGLVDGYAALALVELAPHDTSLTYFGGVAAVTLIYWSWVAITVGLTYYLGRERVRRRGLRD